MPSTAGDPDTIMGMSNPVPGLFVGILENDRDPVVVKMTTDVESKTARYIIEDVAGRKFSILVSVQEGMDFKGYEGIRIAIKIGNFAQAWYLDRLSIARAYQQISHFNGVTPFANLIAPYKEDFRMPPPSNGINNSRDVIAVRIDRGTLQSDVLLPEEDPRPSPSYFPREDSTRRQINPLQTEASWGSKGFDLVGVYEYRVVGATTPPGKTKNAPPSKRELNKPVGGMFGPRPADNSEDEGEDDNYVLVGGPFASMSKYDK